MQELIKRRELEAAVDSISEDFLSDKSFEDEPEPVKLS